MASMKLLIMFINNLLRYQRQDVPLNDYDET